MFKRFVLIIILLQAGFFIATKAQAQSAASDTLKLSIKQAEDLFLKNNLQLIIQRYNIDNANAQVITARLFPNPDFNFSNGIHSNDVTDGPAYKDHSMGISQLFTTAGKRNKNIQLAKISVEQSKYQFFDLLRTLKFTLRNDFYTIYFQQQSASVYNQEITSLSKALTVLKSNMQKATLRKRRFCVFSRNYIPCRPSTTICKPVLIPYKVNLSF